MSYETTRTTRVVEAARGPRRLGVPAALLSALFLAAVMLFWAGPAGADDDDDADGGGYLPREVIVKLAPGAKIGAINRQYKTRVIETLLQSKKIYRLRTPAGVSPPRLAERMENDTNPNRRVVYADLNYRTGSPEGKPRHSARGGGPPRPSNDPAPYTSQYAVGAMKLPQAHAASRRGANVVVAVVDTGVQLNHPEYADRLTAARYDFIDDDRTPSDVRNRKDDDGDGQVDEMAGHGTHVAGLVHLAAPAARIMPLRALNSDGVGNVFVLAEAITYAAKNGANVVNMSLGSSRESELIDDIIEDATEGEEGFRGGVVFAGAAGNENKSIEQYPAAEDDSLAVASVTEQRQKSPFSNFGSSWVDLAAPGSEIYSTFPNSRYATWEGTSMATPLVAGQAALIYRYVPAAVDEPEDRAECVADVIRRTAQPLADTRLGSGHADAVASVRYIKANGCPTEGGGDGGDDGDDDD
jgi:thermitase